LYFAANKSVKPRPVTATSVPSLIGIFQSEWDAIIGETFELRKQLDQVRQELSHTLYQHDAACRVIAKLMKERDEARAALASPAARPAAQPVPAAAPAAAAAASAAATPQSMDIDAEKGITEAMKARMTEKSGELSKGRKKREISASLATEADLAKFAEVSNHPVHKVMQMPLTSFGRNNELRS
jgi:pre-mRNA-processing factor 19